MLAPYHRCVECDNVIDHPICSDCLSENIKAMVSEYDSVLAEEITSVPIYGSSICLFCGKNMGLCPHCFSRDVYLFLEKENIVVAQEFLKRFDFELRKEFH